LADAGPFGKKKKKKKKSADTTEVVKESPLMFEKVETKPFFGDLKVERYTLPSNQLSVLLVHDDSSPTFAYHTYYNVGSGDEQEGITGIAHLFEHMMFKRTSKYDDSHFSKAIEEAGGPDLNAWTWLDMTAYHVSLPTEQLPLIVDLEATRMGSLEIDQAQLDAEREVVRNERKLRVDNEPSGLMNEQLWSIAFEKTGYHWPTIGWDKDLIDMSVEECMTFYKSFYAPNNATIVLAGNFEAEKALRLIQDAYAPIPASELKRLPHGEDAPQTEARRVDMELEIESEMLQLAYKTPALGHADWPALAVLEAVLSNGNTSRIERRLVDSGWASSVSAFLPIFQHEALFEFSVTMRPGKAANAALEILRREVADLRDNLVTDVELNKARSLLLSDQYGQLLSNSGRAGFIGFDEVASGDWQNGFKRLDAYRAVTAEDIQRVAQTYLTDERSSMVVGRPNGKSLAKFSSKSLPEITKPEGELPAVMDRPLEGPPPYEAGAVNQKETGGWTRVLVYDPTTPMVWFRIVLPTGAGDDPADKLGLANVTAEMLLRGTVDRDRDVFERTLEGLGASLGAGVGIDSVTISGSVLKENWPQVANLIAEAFEFPAFLDEDLEDLVAEIQADIVEARNNDRRLGADWYAKGLYGTHSYGRPVLGTGKTLTAISRDDVMEHYQKYFSSRHAILAMLGDFDGGAGGDLARIAGRLQGEGKDEVEPEFPIDPEGRSVWLVDKPGRSQTQMLFGHFFQRPDGEDLIDREAYAHAWLANEVFGGYSFSARMMKEIREKRGWSYGAYGAITHRRTLSAFTMSIAPGAEQSADAAELLMSMFEDFASNGVTSEELESARKGILNSAAFYTDTPSKRLNYVVRRQQTGYDPVALLPLVEAATLEQVNTAASISYDPNNLFGVVVGTASSEVPVGPTPEAPAAVEGEEAAEAPARETKSLKAALQALFGEDAVTVKAYDAE
jgi:zinc protease